MTAAYLLAGCRTPIGKFLGGLSTLPAPQLGALVIRDCIRRAALEHDQIDEVIMGNVLAAGLGQAPARQAALAAGLPDTIAALTINKVCGSGLKAVMLADQAIRCGDARVMVAGGMENMSRAPHLLNGAREGWKFGPQSVVDSMQHDGLWCAHEDVSMGTLADYIASSRNVDRAAQDMFAVESHRRAVEAIANGAFKAELIPVSVLGRKGKTIVDADEGPRQDTTFERLAALRPAFDTAGTVTAGNASQISDGAAALVVAAESVARQHDSPYKARIVASATSGTAPKEIFAAPVDAIRDVLQKANLTLDNIDLFELNEAFAAQCLVCMNEVGIDPDKINVNGGAIALGHPIGASGARVLVTLLHALVARDQQRGLAALCLGGGNAVAMIIERA